MTRVNERAQSHRPEAVRPPRRSPGGQTGARSLTREHELLDALLWARAFMGLRYYGSAAGQIDRALCALRGEES